jgi:hypothetical protein
MRTLKKLDEFRSEAGNALFTKSQAVAVTLRLLEMEMNACETSEESEVFANALKIAHVGYLDSTNTETDSMLDNLGVARITADQIVSAVQSIVFDAE